MYVSTKGPGIKTTILALYIFAVYVLTVTTMKNRPDMVEAPRHSSKSSSASDDILETVQRSLCRNALIVHPTNVILAILGNGITETRAQAVQIVREARERRQSGAVRQVRASHEDST